MSAAEVYPDAIIAPNQDASIPDNTPSDVLVPTGRDARGRILKGHTPNPGGRPKKLREIEKMLNTEHRDVEKMREVFSRLRSLAMGEAVIVPYVNAEGEFALKCELKADARFMQLYLDRLLGPAKAFDDSIDFSTAPAEVLAWLQKYFSGK